MRITPATITAEEPLLAIDEIQGNVIPGFNKNHVRLLFLRIDDAAAAKQWIRQIYPSIATAREVLELQPLVQSG